MRNIDQQGAGVDHVEAGCVQPGIPGVTEQNLDIAEPAACAHSGGHLDVLRVGVQPTAARTNPVCQHDRA
jgi:hypothetical protein